ncbi:hypothetical protein [Enterococcus faecalis]|uniref:hypothetical protein n=2 Tax=Enterococcus faecalis TaxID=1351 RepID=UPI001430F12A|nr:hypothetical protein [Enterococcus faecalis]MDK8151852.1 hypothetical protein [Enterococcus faecalis]MDT2161205.1 hypothetical protein [Enterococcus faecalis]NJJ79600.1 hypothetical protein [Enterococcus faecalis]HAP5949837.1 hypothetical protein [Enterococcus faecalis]HAZ2758785.1 hypothetical protein [Enterococcus faecalis]
MSKLNQLIGFLEEQLTVSEPTPDYTRHNQEIITYIEYLKSMKQPQLNENQQIVLDWLKESCKLHGLREVIEIMGFLSTTGGKMKYKQIAYAYADLNEVELAQVLQAFGQWAFEQEEAE